MALFLDRYLTSLLGDTKGDVVGIPRGGAAQLVLSPLEARVFVSVPVCATPDFVSSVGDDVIRVYVRCQHSVSVHP